MPRDTRPFITVHVGMPWHPKIEGLTDKAFRTLMESWCWCGQNWQTNGHLKATSWQKRGNPAARRELVTSGLFDDDLAGGAIIHDWEQHQRTAAEVEAYKQQRAEDGALGAHRQWHVKRGLREPDCKFCANQ